MANIRNPDIFASPVANAAWFVVVRPCYLNRDLLSGPKGNWLDRFQAQFLRNWPVRAMRCCMQCYVILDHVMMAPHPCTNTGLFLSVTL